MGRRILKWWRSLRTVEIIGGVTVTVSGWASGDYAITISSDEFIHGYRAYESMIAHEFKWGSPWWEGPRVLAWRIRRTIRKAGLS